MHVIYHELFLIIVLNIFKIRWKNGYGVVGSVYYKFLNRANQSLLMTINRITWRISRNDLKKNM